MLDTDGVNAFAAPGGFVHITRGRAGADSERGRARRRARSRDRAHHDKHTINAIQKAKLAGTIAASSAAGSSFEQLANKAYEVVLENNFDRDEEGAADRIGLGLANKVGLLAGRSGAFLTKLAERNKGLKERSGFFASHPAMTRPGSTI